MDILKLIEEADKATALNFKAPDNLEPPSPTVPNMVLGNTIVTKVSPGEVLEEEVKDLVTHLNGEYFLTGKYPSLSVLTERYPFLTEYGGEQLEDLFTQVNDILENARDCPPYQVKYKKIRELDPIFVAACNLIMDIGDKRSLQAKLKAVGLTTGKFNSLLKIKIHREYYNTLVDNLMDFDAWQQGRLALARNVANGDLASFKYFNELTDKYVEKRDFDPRIITHFMSAMLEIVAQNVDASTARKIADQIESAAISQLGPVIDVSTTAKEISNDSSEPIL